MIALRLERRRDGSVCVTDGHGSTTSPDREFPSPHGFTYDKLLELGAELVGDRVTLTLANGRAVYQIVERVPTGVNVELVESSLSDPPPIDEGKAAEIAAARAEREAAERLAAAQAIVDGDPDAMVIGPSDVANAGSVLVDEEA